MPIADLKQLALNTVSAFGEDRAERLGAALAYYAIFSLAPLAVLTLAIAGRLYGRGSGAGRDALLSRVEGLFGGDGAAFVEALLEGAAAMPAAGTWAAALSGVLLLVGATAFFARLQEAMNTIWNAHPSYTGLVGFLWSRGWSLLLVIGAAGAVVTGLLAHSLLMRATSLLPAPWLLLWLERVGSLGLLTLLCGVLYRTLPDTSVRWTDVWAGAALAALLLTAGTWAFGAYLARGAVSSSYGAAGALVALLLWVYYAAQIFFLGAELTTVVAAPPSSAPEAETRPPAPKDPSPARTPPWLRPLGWIGLGVVLAWLLRR